MKAHPEKVRAEKCVRKKPDLRLLTT